MHLFTCLRLDERSPDAARRSRLTVCPRPLCRPSFSSYGRYMTLESGSAKDGFTLVELMVTIAVAGVLLALAVPGFQRYVLDAKRSEVVNELVNSFQLARSEAIRRGQEVGICASSNGTACSSNSTDWSQGWMVFLNADPIADTAPTCCTGADEILRVYRQPSSNIVVTSTSASAGVTSGRFKARAFGQTNANGTVKVCDPRGSSEGRSVVVSISGTVRLQDTSITCP